MRPRHPKKDVEAVLAEAEAAGWTVTPKPRGHSWGVMKCTEGSRAGCQYSIWSTPRNPGDHAKDLWRFVRRCPHR